MSEINPESQNVAAILADVPVITDVVQESTESDVHHKDHDVEKTVPLSVVQKERKKRQQLQEELDFLKKQRDPPAALPQEDYSKYESVTREDLSKSQFTTVRAVSETLWSKDNPEKVIFIENELEDFLKQRPNLRSAIDGSLNRYEEAWVLMNALNPRQKVEAKTVKRDAPNAPGTVPKAAAINETLDVMGMSDSEFRDWAKSRKKR